MWGFELILGLRREFGSVLDDEMQRKNPVFPGFAKVRRGPVLGRRGARLVTGEVWPLT